MTGPTNEGYLQRYVLSPWSTVRNTVSNLSHTYLPTPVVDTFTRYVYNPIASAGSTLYSIVPWAYNAAASIPSKAGQKTIEYLTGTPPSPQVARFDLTVEQHVNTEEKQQKKVEILRGLAAFANPQNGRELVARMNAGVASFMERMQGAFHTETALPSADMGAVVTAYQHILSPAHFFDTYYSQAKTGLQSALVAQNERVITSLSDTCFSADLNALFYEKIQESIVGNNRAPLQVYFDAFVEEMLAHLNASKTDLTISPNDHLHLPLISLLEQELKPGSNWRMQMETAISSCSNEALWSLPAQMQSTFSEIGQARSATLLDSYDIACSLYLNELKLAASDDGSALKQCHASLSNAGKERAENALKTLEDALPSLLHQGTEQFAAHGETYRARTEARLNSPNIPAPAETKKEGPSADGLIGQISDHASKKIDELMATTKHNATKRAHPFLVETETVLKRLKGALPKNGTLRKGQLDLIEDVRAKISRLIDHRIEAAPTANGLFKELLAIQAQLTALSNAKSVTEVQHLALSTRLDAALPLIDHEIQQQQGYIAQAIESGLRQIGEKFQPIVDYFSPKEQADSDGETLPLSSLILFAKHYLSSHSDKTSGFKKFLNVAILLLNALPKAKDLLHKHAGVNPKFLEIESAVNTSLALLRKGVDDFDIESFEQGLDGSLKAIDSIRVYANTIKLPPGLNVITLSLKELVDGALGDPEVVAAEKESHLIDLVNESERASIQTSLVPEQVAKEDIVNKIAEQKDLFVKNTAKMAKLRLVFEYICGIKNDGLDLYIELIHKYPNQAELREKALEKLEQHKVSWIKLKLCSFLLSTKLIEKILTQAIGKMNQYILDFIDANKGNQFAHLRHQMIHNFNSYLYILIGAYRRIGANNTYTGELKDMLASELETPQFNGGFTSAELYAEFSKLTIQACLPNPFYRWVAKKAIGKEGELIDNLVKSALSTVVDYNGYSHAINTVILEQVETLYNEIANGKEPTEEEKIALRNLSINVKGDIKSLVQNMLELLQIGPNTTPSQLYATARNKNPLHVALGKSVDALFIDDAVQAASENIAVAFRTLLTEDRIKELLYKIVRLANETYQRGEPVPPSEFQEKEKRLKETSERLLRLVVKKSVDEALQPRGEKDQKYVNDTILELKTEIESPTGFLCTSQALLDELSQMDLITPLALNKIEALQSHAQAFFSYWHRKAREIDGSEISTENKELLLNLIDKGLSSHAKEFNTLLCNITESAKNNTAGHETGLICNAFFSSARTLLAQMGERYDQFDLSKLADAVLELQTQATAFERYAKTQPIAAELKAKINQIAIHSTDFKKKYTLFGIHLDGNLENLCNELTSLRVNNLSSAPSEREKEIVAQATAMISETDPSFQSAFSQQIQRILVCKHKAYLCELRDQMNVLLKTSRDESEDYVVVQGKMQNLINECCHIIHGSGTLKVQTPDEQRIHLWHLVKTARASMGKLGAWKERELEPLTFINLSILPHQKIKQFAGTVVSRRIREKMHGFMSFFRDPLHYRYGVLHHSLMIPIVKSLSGEKAPVATEKK